MPRALFVSHEANLTDASGGVQICTQEYLEAIAAAGIDIEVCTLGSARSLLARLSKRLDSSEYSHAIPPGFVEKLQRAISNIAPDIIFLNQVNLSGLAKEIRRFAPRCTIIALSHGMEITDQLHLARLWKRLPLSGRLKPTPTVALGRTLLQESEARRCLDGVVALSPSDEVLESWVGTRATTWLPRTIRSNPLAWAPTGRRVGYVGTLDHAPNLEGLVDVLEQQSPASPELEFRLVGGPGSIGRWLAQSFPGVCYLGPLDDAALRSEAATWRAFLHPIFCLPRGCSTKLATGMSWHIPIVTTPAGRRGYFWAAGGLIEAKDPTAFHRAAVGLLNDKAAQRARQDVERACATAPNLADVAERLQLFLASLSPGGGA